MKFIKNMDQEKVTQDEKKLLTALSSQTPEEKEMPKNIENKTSESIQKLEVEKVSSLVLANES